MFKGRNSKSISPYHPIIIQSYLREEKVRAYNKVETSKKEVAYNKYIKVETRKKSKNISPYHNIKLQ